MSDETYAPEWWPLMWEPETEGNYKRVRMHLGGHSLTVVDFDKNIRRAPYWAYWEDDPDREQEWFETLLEVYCWLLARDPANPHREDTTHGQEHADP